MVDETHPLDLLPGYVLECLDEADQIAVLEHVAACALCQAELRAYRAVADQLALAAPEAAPGPALKNRLLERLHPPPLPSPGRRERPGRTGLEKRSWPGGLLWGGLAALLVLVVLGSLWLWQQANPPQMAVGPGGMQAIALDGVGAAPQASGFVIISPDGQNGALVVDGLPPLDPDRQYQVWLVRAGQRSSGALFSVDESGYGGVRLRAPRSLLEYSAVEITIEPAEGSPAPSGELVLGGRLEPR